MQGISFPTGKVDIVHMYPMTFMEFQKALNEASQYATLADSDSLEMSNILLPTLTDILRQYYFVGGMPEAVAEFIKNRNVQKVRQIQSNILEAYEADIAKHAGVNTLRARMVFQAIPAQLAKENKKFIFGALKKGARASDYETAIQWLIDAGLVYKVRRMSKVALPVNFYYQQDGFKLFLLDVGLIGAMAQTDPSLMLVGNNVFSEYKGAFTENYVMTQLVAHKDCVIGYYAKENSTMELDFIVQYRTHLLPIEVKAETNVKSKSLRNFITCDNAGSNLHGYRFSMQGYQKQDWVTNIPLFAIDPFLNSLS
jgi:hypothetical protein